MPKQPDLERLANAYLDLWQDQMAAMAADPVLTETMSRLFALTSAGAGPAFSQEAEQSRDANRQNSKQSGNGAEPTTAAGAEAAAAAPRDGGYDLGELARRIAAIEERLAALESGSGDGGGGA